MTDETDHEQNRGATDSRESLETKMIEAMNSGPSIEVTPGFWKQLKERVHRKLAEPQK